MQIEFKDLPRDEALQFMPVLKNKRPIHTGWEKTKKEYDFTKCEAVGLVCGTISGGLEAIDIDIKYDLTGTLLKDYKNAIRSIDTTLLSKLVVQKTINKGYHLIYQCDYIEGNKKLAQRETTFQEKKDTYDKTYSTAVKDGLSEAEAKLKAEKSGQNDKVRVLLETRGEKGYIACYPTEGYSLLSGDLSKITRITKEQRDILFSVAYSFNEYQKEPDVHKEITRKEYAGLSPSEDYNLRGDVVGLLEKYGWKNTGRKGSKILMLRPGDTKAAHSGNFDTEKKWFSVFTTSTEFESQKPYKPYAVYCLLECGGDYQKVPKSLYEAGYGDRIEEITVVNKKVPSQIDLTDENLDFLATEADCLDYLDSWRKGTFEMGKTTGIELLDKYFLFKEGNFVIINGLDNVGKSTVIWYLALLSALFHKWKWLIFSSENRVGGVFRKLIEFYWSEPIDTMSDEKYQIAKKFVYEHFDVIKCNERLFNYQDLLNMFTKASAKKKYHGFMIDPYNSLKMDIPTTSKGDKYDYHYEAASIMQLFCKQKNISMYLNCHVGTAASRNYDKDNMVKPPQKGDTEMGVMFGNKADDFITIHRHTQHETDWGVSEIHIRKIKETETGGRPTPAGAPIKLRMTKGLTGFFDANGDNPVLKYHNRDKIKLEQAQIDFNLPPVQLETVDFTNNETEDENVPF